MQPEPTDFYDEVKKDGDDFLFEVPRPTTEQWKGKEYWRRALPDAMREYGSICAYCAMRLITPASPSIDHYVPRKDAPELAYEWSNFRLAAFILNTRKNKYRDILDPFTLQQDSFQINFDTFMIVPAPDMPANDKVKVRDTVTRLKLNDDEAFVESRMEWIEEYLIGEISFQHLTKQAPFIAYEIKRQGMCRPEDL